MTFVADNIDFLAEQLASPRHEAAARGADLVLDELGIAYRTLPYAFRVDAQELADLERATVLLADAQDTLLTHLVAQHSPDELSAMFSVPGPMAAQLDWPTVATRGMRALRADIIPTDTGYAFCEVNHFCAVGGCDAYYSALAYADLLGRPMAGVSPMRQLAVQYADAMRANGWTRLVILDSSKHRPQGFGEHVMLQRFLHWLLPEAEIHYCDELTFPQRWLASGRGQPDPRPPVDDLRGHRRRGCPAGAAARQRHGLLVHVRSRAPDAPPVVLAAVRSRRGSACCARRRSRRSAGSSRTPST